MSFALYCGFLVCVLHFVSGTDKMLSVKEEVDNEIESDGRIIGGYEASPGEFPYQISMRRHGSHMCGGSIINKNYILTAAHCLVGQSKWQITVVTGTNSLGFGGDTYYVEDIIAHPAYNNRIMQNDIGLIKLSGDIKFKSTVQPIAISNGVVPDGSELVLSGWGSTSYPGGSPPMNLQAINLIAYNNGMCKHSHASRMPVTMNQVCTLNKAGEGACHGDSGGPLAYNGEQVGVVSWGYPCAKGYPDVFTSVSAFSDWIRDNMVMN